MAESEHPGYTYRVLTVRTLGEQTPPAPPRQLIDLGEHTARTPELAVEVAVENGGVPLGDGGRYVAVPVTRWHERDVVIEQRPHVSVTRAVPEDDITADPR